MTLLRVYIASTGSCSACLRRAREAAAKIEAAGHQVMSTWHREPNDRDLVPTPPMLALRRIDEMEHSSHLIWLAGEQPNVCGNADAAAWEIGWASSRGRHSARISSTPERGSEPLIASLMTTYESVEDWLKEEVGHG